MSTKHLRCGQISSSDGAGAGASSKLPVPKLSSRLSLSPSKPKDKDDKQTIQSQSGSQYSTATVSNNDGTTYTASVALSLGLSKSPAPAPAPRAPAKLQRRRTQLGGKPAAAPSQKKNGLWTQYQASQAKKQQQQQKNVRGAGAEKQRKVEEDSAALLPAGRKSPPRSLASVVETVTSSSTELEDHRQHEYTQAYQPGPHPPTSQQKSIFDPSAPWAPKPPSPNSVTDPEPPGFEAAGYDSDSTIYASSFLRSVNAQLASTGPPPGPARVTRTPRPSRTYKDAAIRSSTLLPPASDNGPSDPLPVVALSEPAGYDSDNTVRHVPLSGRDKGERKPGPVPLAPRPSRVDRAKLKKGASRERQRVQGGSYDSVRGMELVNPDSSISTLDLPEPEVSTPAAQRDEAGEIVMTRSQDKGKERAFPLQNAAGPMQVNPGDTMKRVSTQVEPPTPPSSSSHISFFKRWVHTASDPNQLDSSLTSPLVKGPVAAHHHHQSPLPAQSESQAAQPSALPPTRCRKNRPVELILTTPARPRASLPAFPSRPQTRVASGRSRGSRSKPSPSLLPAPLRVTPRSARAAVMSDPGTPATERWAAPGEEYEYAASEPDAVLGQKKQHQDEQGGWNTGGLRETGVVGEAGEEVVVEYADADLSPATYPWLSLSLIRQVRQTFRMEFDGFQRQVAERLRVLEEKVEQQGALVRKMFEERETEMEVWQSE